jgi:hypothetical protein
MTVSAKLVTNVTAVQCVEMCTVCVNGAGERYTVCKTPSDLLRLWDRPGAPDTNVAWGMPRSPDDPVVRDSQSTLWAMMREGLYHSSEVSASGHWHPSQATTPWQSIQAQTPYGRQQRPTLSIVPPSPSTPVRPPTPSPPPRLPLGERRAAEANVYKNELAHSDRKRAARAAAMRKIEEAMRDLELAEQM